MLIRKINALLWLCNIKKKITIILKIKEGTRRRRQTISKPEKVHSTGEFVIVAKFGDHVLRCLASSVSNMIGQAGRLASKTSSLGDFFRIQYLVTAAFSCFKCYTVFGFGSAKTIP